MEKIIVNGEMGYVPRSLPEKMAFAAFVKELETGKGKTQQATEMGTSTQTMRNIEIGKIVPGRMIARALMQYYDGMITLKDFGYED